MMRPSGHDAGRADERAWWLMWNGSVAAMSPAAAEELWERVERMLQAEGIAYVGGRIEMLDDEASA